MSHLRDPLAVARGLGSAKDGTGHWWMQRLTATALLLLSPWFLVLVWGLAGVDRHVAGLILSQPLNVALMIAWIISLFWHAQLGLQVVIEDYVRGWAEIALVMATRLLCTLGVIAGILAVSHILLAP
jgi:succinate dehydrogenase / fumarate reductase membrane anchor subunit